MSIQRHSPEVGSMTPELFDQIGASMIVVHNGVARMAGVTAVTGGLGDIRVVGVGDMGAQLEFILQLLDRLLEHAGSSRDRLLELTAYTTDVRALGAQLGQLAAYAGEHRPVVNMIGVAALGHPDALLEIVAAAAVDA